jgi:hypothetical protein
MNWDWAMAIGARIKRRQAVINQNDHLSFLIMMGNPSLIREFVRIGEFVRYELICHDNVIASCWPTILSDTTRIWNLLTIKQLSIVNEG